MTPLLLPALSLLACSTGEVLGPCPAYSGIGEAGPLRTYEKYDEEYEDALEAWVSVEALVADDDGTVVVEAVSYVEWPGDAISHGVSETVYRCDDEGLFSVSASGVSEVSSPGTSVSSEAAWVYDPPSLEVLRDVEPGDSWRSVFDVVDVSDDAGDDPTRMCVAMTITVGDREERRVPEGKLSVLPFVYEGDFGDGIVSPPVTMYYNEVYGLVENSSVKLVSVE